MEEAKMRLEQVEDYRDKKYKEMPSEPAEDLPSNLSRASISTCEGQPLFEYPFPCGLKQFSAIVG